MLKTPPEAFRPQQEHQTVREGEEMELSPSVSLACCPPHRGFTELVDTPSNVLYSLSIYRSIEREIYTYIYII